MVLKKTKGLVENTNVLYCVVFRCCCCYIEPFSTVNAANHIIQQVAPRGWAGAGGGVGGGCSQLLTSFRVLQ